jgi:hypothetical protein
MATGAVLNLSGNGKSFSGSNNAPDGALRFQLASRRSAEHYQSVSGG